MVGLVKDKLEAIKALCKEHHVQSLHLFGSAARGTDFQPGSDLDFLVSFRQQGLTPFTGTYGVCRELKEQLEKLTGRKVDIVEEKHIENKYLRYFIDKEKQLIYGISSPVDLA